MATRLYLPDMISPVDAVSNGSWQESNTVQRALRPEKSSTTFVNKDKVVSGWGVTYCMLRAVSPPLASDQTISGTVKAQARSQVVSNTAERFEIYVVSRNGLTVRGTPLAVGNHKNTNITINDLYNKTYADGDSLTSVNALAGDRIVVCFGVQYAYSSGGVRINIGDNSGTDLPENESDNNAYCPWVEFSANLTFGADLPTRLYLTSNAAAVTPVASYNSWATGLNVNKALARDRTGSGDTACGGSVPYAYTFCLFYTGVSEPLAANCTITGTIKCYAMGSFVSGTMYDALEAYVVTNDGSSVRGTLLGASNWVSSTFYYSRRNKGFADSDVVSSVAAQAGDRIVVKIGGYPYSSGITGYIWCGDSAGTYVPQDETGTTTKDPWVEFSYALSFLFERSTADTMAVPDSFSRVKWRGGTVSDSAAVTEHGEVTKYSYTLADGDKLVPTDSAIRSKAVDAYVPRIIRYQRTIT